jgi:glycosyltransferase involved in cell wall biosynthesis
VDAPAHFTGYVEGEDLARIYASADFMVFPSTTDTFGNVVLEAQASGIPIIVSDQGGPKENLIDGETGFVIKASLADGFAAAMRTLSTDAALRQRMGGAARRYMSNRDFESAFKSLVDLYTGQTTEHKGHSEDLPFSGLLKIGGL